MIYSFIDAEVDENVIRRVKETSRVANNILSVLTDLLRRDPSERCGIAFLYYILGLACVIVWLCFNAFK